jgi:endonuclease IV
VVEKKTTQKERSALFWHGGSIFGEVAVCSDTVDTEEVVPFLNFCHVYQDLLSL